MWLEALAGCTPVLISPNDDIMKLLSRNHTKFFESQTIM